MGNNKSKTNTDDKIDNQTNDDNPKEYSPVCSKANSIDSLGMERCFSAQLTRHR